MNYTKAFKVKNDVLKVFNLIQNKFTEKSFDNIVKVDIREGSRDFWQLIINSLLYLI